MRNTSEANGSRYATEQGDNIIKIGNLMRPIRLDEIPQFFDILRGTMSFIGPRPEQPRFAEELSEELPYYKLRHKVKTGLTGWAQTNYKYAATIEEQEKKLSYDLFYVKNQSTMLDLQIILKTFETVLFRKGAK
jgi:lipopolysaccharide/colanic/teichoic acid biosynthesis glycosyltransferase